MAGTTNISKLIINYLTEEQYTTAKASGLIDANELYIESAQRLLGVAHPANHAPAIITQDADNRFVTDIEKAAWSGKAAGTHKTQHATGGADVLSPADIGAAAATHSHAASEVNSGTLAGQVVANATAVATLTTAQIRNISGGTADLTAGVTALPTGDIYAMYE